MPKPTPTITFPAYTDIGNAHGILMVSLAINSAASRGDRLDASALLNDFAMSMLNVLAEDVLRKSATVHDCPIDTSNLIRTVQLLVCMSREISLCPPT